MDQALHPFHDVRHPAEMGAAEIQAREASPTWLWREMSPPLPRARPSARTSFSTKRCFTRTWGSIEAIRAKKPKRLPSVLTEEEMQHVLGHLSGTHLLISKLLYGSGLRLTPALAP